MARGSAREKFPLLSLSGSLFPQSGYLNPLFGSLNPISRLGEWLASVAINHSFWIDSEELPQSKL